MLGEATTVEVVALAGGVRGRRATQIPPLRMLVDKVAAPVPVVPGVAIVIMAAPREVAVLVVPLP